VLLYQRADLVMIDDPHLAWLNVASVIDVTAHIHGVDAVSVVRPTVVLDLMCVVCGLLSGSRVIAGTSKIEDKVSI
jgi:hypothetical protein